MKIGSPSLVLNVSGLNVSGHSTFILDTCAQRMSLESLQDVYRCHSVHDKVKANLDQLCEGTGIEVMAYCRNYDFFP